MFLCLNPSAALVLFGRLCLILREIHGKRLLLAGPARVAAQCIAGELLLSCGSLQVIPCVPQLMSPLQRHVSEGEILM